MGSAGFGNKLKQGLVSTLQSSGKDTAELSNSFAVSGHSMMLGTKSVAVPDVKPAPQQTAAQATNAAGTTATQASGAEAGSQLPQENLKAAAPTPAPARESADDMSASSTSPIQLGAA